MFSHLYMSQFYDYNKHKMEHWQHSVAYFCWKLQICWMLLSQEGPWHEASLRAQGLVPSSRPSAPSLWMRSFIITSISTKFIISSTLAYQKNPWLWAKGLQFTIKPWVSSSFSSLSLSSSTAPKPSPDLHRTWPHPLTPTSLDQYLTHHAPLKAFCHLQPFWRRPSSLFPAAETVIQTFKEDEP